MDWQDGWILLEGLHALERRKVPLDCSYGTYVAQIELHTGGAAMQRRQHVVVVVVVVSRRRFEQKLPQEKRLCAGGLCDISPHQY